MSFDRKAYMAEYRKQYRLTHSRTEESRKREKLLKIRRDLERKKEPSLIVDKTNKASLPYIKPENKGIYLKRWRESSKEKKENKISHGIILFDSFALSALLLLEDKSPLDTHTLIGLLGFSSFTWQKVRNKLLAMKLVNIEQDHKGKRYFISEFGKVFLLNCKDSLKDLAMNTEEIRRNPKETRSMIMHLLMKEQQKQDGISQ